MSQVDALETRLSKSRGWLNGIGNAVNFWEDDFKIRQQDVVSDAADKNVTQSITNRLALGFDALTTIAIDEATGILTFDANGGANPAPVIASSFVVGDEIEIVSAVAGVGTIRYIISALLAGGLTIQLNNTYQAVATAAAALQFSRVRSVLINNDSRKLQQFELIWTPPLSMFKIGHAVPNGKFELLLNPQTASVYQKAAIESLLGAGDKDTGVGVDNFIFTVENMYLYVNTVDGNRCDDITYLLDLEQTRCQADKVNNASFGQKSWDVSPSTYALTVAYQDLRAGTNTQASATKFKSYNAALNSEEETKLDRFFINYAGQNLPAPDADPNYVVATGIDYTTQRYIESQIYSGTYYTSGGGESIQEYKARGSYYYFSIPRDGTDRSTRVTVNQGFAAGTDTDNMRVLLFDHSKQVASVRIQDGRVIDVKLDDA
jgi:hypothetical protein